jgi:EAL domain-containing protein (putative c-di-GMP-specific phosphodiesterase class I)
MRPPGRQSDGRLPIGAWALHEACRQAAAWRAELGDRAPLPLFLNLSARQLVRPDLMATVARAVTEAGIDFGDIGVEVTESVLIDASAISMRNVRALRGAGVRVLLDDFGTGYSSLRHLNTLPLDGLKIDQSFIAGMEHDSRNEAIVRAVAAMGREMGMRVVAEGIETPEQEALAREFGCAMVQGFRFATAVRPEDMRGLLDRVG